MTKNSKICQIMETHGSGWRKYFEETYPDIMINDAKAYFEDCPYLLFIYGIGANFKDPVVQEARGIIINEETHEVVCWPFRKFGKYYESYADEIDWETASVQEKIDGSIVKLWYSKYDVNNQMNGWVFSSNTCIHAAQAPTKLRGYHSMLDIIKNCDNFKCLEENICHLDKDKTYIFEVTYPNNRLVVRHDKCSLYHIGTRNNITGIESNDDIGIQKPKRYSLSNLEECVNYLEQSSLNSEGLIDSCEHEGFVVVDDQFNRIKIKSPIYVILHNILSNSDASVKLLIKYLIDDKINIAELSIQYPEKARVLRYYKFNVDEILYGASILLEIARECYKRTHSRRCVADLIKDDPLSFIAFKGLYNTDTVKEILEKHNINIAKLIPKYESKKEGNDIMKIDIIKDKYKYRYETCPHCKSELRFVKSTIQYHYEKGHQIAEYKCPCCGKEAILTQ